MLEGKSLLMRQFHFLNTYAHTDANFLETCDQLKLNVEEVAIWFNEDPDFREVAWEIELGAMTKMEALRDEIKILNGGTFTYTEDKEAFATLNK